MIRVATRSDTPSSTCSSDEACWRAVVTRSHNADDRFYYAVMTTGVYCRPSCAARLARRENVGF
jgi:AraC family transcriptional regulator, regulatory protein of adaptative response / methylated-DNA-[protein]-cysteine methyltransferase